MGQDRRKAVLQGENEGPKWGRDEGMVPMGGPGTVCPTVS